MRNEFRKARSIKMSYERQGLIFFTLRTYDQQPANVRKRIDGLIRDASGGDKQLEKGLREWLVKGVGAEKVIQERYLPKMALYDARKKIYAMW